MYPILKGQLVVFFLEEPPANEQQKDVEVDTLLFLSVNGTIALNPLLAEMTLKLWISSSLVLQLKLKFSKLGVMTSWSLSQFLLSLDVACLILK
jgi:hypothetical protein